MQNIKIRPLMVIFLLSSIQCSGSSEAQHDERYQRYLKISLPEQGEKKQVSSPALKTTDRFKGKEYWVSNGRLAYGDSAPSNSKETKPH